MNSEELLKTWNVYQSAWGIMSPAKRHTLLSQSVSDGIRYTDPDSVVVGLESLIDRIEATQKNFPGGYFKNDKFSEHHGLGLFHWTMYDAGDLPIAKGTSYGEFDEAGKLKQATGFYKLL